MKYVLISSALFVCLFISAAQKLTKYIDQQLTGSQAGQAARVPEGHCRLVYGVSTKYQPSYFEYYILISPRADKYQVPAIMFWVLGSDFTS